MQELAEGLRLDQVPAPVRIHVEPQLQQLLLPRRRLVAVLNVAYVTLNVGLTVGWLIRLFRRGDPQFHRLRSAAVLTTLGAQPVFLFFPCAPPRTLDHFVDTIVEVSGVDLDRGVVARLYDPLAAMPSIHVAYAVVTAAGIAETSRSGAARALAPAYPPLVALVVFATANHYVLDAVAGGALPLAEIPSFACSLEHSLAQPLRHGEPSVVGIVRDDRLLLDCRTLTDAEVEEVAEAVRRCRSR